MGNFDECLGANDAPQLRHHLPGSAFCLATLRLRAAEEAGRSSRDRGASARDFYKVYPSKFVHTTTTTVLTPPPQPPQHRLQVDRNVVRWGVCVPSSCGPRELTALLGRPLRSLAEGRAPRTPRPARGPERRPEALARSARPARRPARPPARRRPLVSSARGGSHSSSESFKCTDRIVAVPGRSCCGCWPGSCFALSWTSWNSTASRVRLFGVP